MDHFLRLRVVSQVDKDQLAVIGSKPSVAHHWVVSYDLLVHCVEDLDVRLPNAAVLEPKELVLLRFHLSDRIQEAAKCTLSVKQ